MAASPEGPQPRRGQTTVQFQLRNPIRDGIAVLKREQNCTYCTGHLQEEGTARSTHYQPPEADFGHSCPAVQLEHPQRRKNNFTQSLRKLDFEVDSETKNLIINGDRVHLAMILRRLLALSEANPMEDSLETEEFKKRHQKNE